MPWLQLEDENLDVLAKNTPKSKPRESRTTDAEPVIMLVSECVCVCAHACVSGRGGTSLVREAGGRKRWWRDMRAKGRREWWEEWGGWGC